MSTADVCRKLGVSSATFYKRKARYGGLEVSDARRLRGEAVAHVVEIHGVSQCRACQAPGRGSVERAVSERSFGRRRSSGGDEGGRGGAAALRL